MKIYSKLLGKIRNNKTRFKKAIGIVSIAIKLKYNRTDLISRELLLNSTKQNEQVVKIDSTIKDALSNKSSNYFINTGSRISINDSEGSKSLLTIRAGDLGKSSPGARARADARRNFNKRKQSSIIPGASGYTPQQIYNIYRSGKRPTLQIPAEPPQTEVQVPVPDGITPRIGPEVSLSPNRQDRIQSQPLRIKSEHQKTDVIITKKDIKKWITPEQRKQTSNQKINEEKVKEKFVNIVKKPDEILDGIHIYQEEKECKIYIKNVESSDGTHQKLALIADTKTGRSYLGSILTEEEYWYLKETGEIYLFDLQRDPQTSVMNQQSIQEAEILSRAKDEGCLTGFGYIRRPYNLLESRTDFVGYFKGSKINIDIKAIDGSGRRSLDRQTQDINQNIKNLFDGADDPLKLHIICDISETPTFFQDTVIKNITEGLDSDQLDNINFLFD